MLSTFRALLAGSVVIWAAAFVAQDMSPVVDAAAVQTATTNDGIYTKAQADKAKAQFDKICADCHPFTVAAKKRPKDVPLGDEPFFEAWTGRPLRQMVTTIVLTMPNDGSAVVNDEEAVDLIAYILQQNGYPAGSQPLTKATASAVVERPKK